LKLSIHDYGYNYFSENTGKVTYAHNLYDATLGRSYDYDHLGRLVESHSGETNRSSNQAFQPHRFTTYERDANQSDEAMHRRYNRWWSRFDQPDPYDSSNVAANIHPIVTDSTKKQRSQPELTLCWRSPYTALFPRETGTSRPGSSVGRARP
jgi:hypothetical protein